MQTDSLDQCFKHKLEKRHNFPPNDFLLFSLQQFWDYGVPFSHTYKQEYIQLTDYGVMKCILMMHISYKQEYIRLTLFTKM